ERPAVEEALAEVTAVLDKEPELRLRLDPLYEALHAEPGGERDHDLDKDGRLLVVRKVADVGAVDLERVRAELAQAAERRMAGAEVVDPHAEGGASRQRG